MLLHKKESKTTKHRKFKKQSKGNSAIPETLAPRPQPSPSFPTLRTTAKANLRNEKTRIESKGDKIERKKAKVYDKILSWDRICNSRIGWELGILGCSQSAIRHSQFSRLILESGKKNSVLITFSYPDGRKVLRPLDAYMPAPPLS